MLRQQVKESFEKLTVWKRRNERAPHKPLLLLMALGKCLNENRRQIPFVEFDEPLIRLLKDFGPPRKSFHSEYPFWRLQNDGIWELENAENCILRESNSDAKKTELRKYDVTGGFTPEIYQAIRQDRKLANSIARDLLSAHFPDSFHDDILEAVGLRVLRSVVRQKSRDHRFRDLVLRSYEFRCAICNYDISVLGKTVGLEAAHIQWHQACGPDVQENGLSLCSLHHKLFDRGVIGLNQDRRILVSQDSHGNESFDQWVLAFNGQLLRQPRKGCDLPNLQYLAWHSREVFRSPPRSYNL